MRTGPVDYLTYRISERQKRLQRPDYLEATAEILACAHSSSVTGELPDRSSHSLVLPSDFTREQSGH
jgi:hypothetical protein